LFSAGRGSLTVQISPPEFILAEETKPRRKLCKIDDREKELEEEEGDRA
jgi:hypothetical protein